MQTSRTGVVEDASFAGLTTCNFVQVGGRGVTDARNSYSQAMAWFKNRLYVGMTRDSLCLLKRPARKLQPPKMEFWPVKCPEQDTPELWRGQILSYDPAAGVWDKVYESPLVTVRGELVMRDVGYRGMTLHRSPGEGQEALYVGSMSGAGAIILRSEDGVNFETTGAALGSATSIRSLVSFNGRLYAAILGKSGHHPNESEHTEVYESADPATGRWRPVSLPGFGDPTNRSVFELGKFNGFLYAATMNSVSGFELWKTDAQGQAPYRWKKVITAGAYRGFLNQYGMCIVEHGGCLYVGTGISGGGYDQVYKVGPAPSELIRVYPDDTWDLVVGTPRATPDGVKVPLSGLLAGFNNFLNGYTWRMCSHDGWLYVGTMNAAAFIPYKPYSTQRVGDIKLREFERLLPTGSFEKFIEEYGGCHLWATRDGERFSPVTQTGFGTPYNMGIRQMASTPYGLFVGTANPFGPLVGVKRDGVWGYEENPRGGSEIWLGSTDVKALVCHDRQRETRQRQYRHALLKTGHMMERLLHHLMTEEYYENSDYRHIGYWGAGAGSALEACEALMDRVVALMPEKKGAILDVACGKGATTRRLLRHFDPSEITGIDESNWILDFPKRNVPGPRFLPMDPARLEFGDSSFDNIVCVEAAATFDTRFRFFREAHRVLRPGGRLVLADIISSREAVLAARGRYRSNYLRDAAAYRRLLERAGFPGAGITIEDITGETLSPYVGNVSRYLKDRYRAREISEGKYNAAMLFVSRITLFARSYLLVAAVK